MATLTAADRARIRAAIDARRRDRECVEMPDGSWRRKLSSAKLTVLLPDPSPAGMFSPGRRGWGSALSAERRKPTDS